MSFSVRLYGHQGIVPMLVVNTGGQDHKDSVYQLSQPYVWTQTLTASATPVTLTLPITFLPPFNADVSNVLRIEVPDGQAIRYEISTPNVSRTAGSASPKMSGSDQFQWGTGWSISIVDASSFP